MPKDGDGRIAGVHLLPQPKHGDRPRFAGNRLDLPGTGEFRFGGGQRVVLLAQVGQVGGGEGVIEGDGGTLIPLRKLRMSLYLGSAQLSPSYVSGVHASGRSWHR
jgi:hypothetical protein